MSKEICKWTFKELYSDEYNDFWETECGEAFTVLEGTPKDNRIKYCPYCGKIIKEQK